MIINDGSGKGYSAKVSDKNRLLVSAKSASAQHEVSHESGQAYQVLGTASLSSGTVPVLHIKNTSSSRDLIVSYIQWQVLDNTGGTTLPNASNYMQLAFDRTYSSGGSAVTATNVNRASGNEAEVTAYDSDPTLSGTAVEVDRWYPAAEGDMHTWNKEGSVILGQGDTLEVSFVGDQSSGTAFARISFYMAAKE